MKDNIKTYNVPRRAGIDDLQSNLPGDMATEWWTDLDWQKWHDELPERKRKDEEYIKELKEKGEYGKEYNLNFSLVSHPLFDEPKDTTRKPLISSSIFIMDLNKPTQNEKD